MCVRAFSASLYDRHRVAVRRSGARAARGAASDVLGLIDILVVGIVVGAAVDERLGQRGRCLLYTSPSPRDGLLSRMPSSA